MKRKILFLGLLYSLMAGVAFAQVVTPQRLILAGTILLIALALAFFHYLYFSLCLWLIAKKTNNAPAWLAWIPVANLFFMCKIVKVSFWWLLLLLTAYIPFIGAVAILFFICFIGYKLALARYKPGWLGALICLPVAGLIILGYLAFSK